MTLKENVTPLIECKSRDEIETCQGKRLNRLLYKINGRNSFYTSKFLTEHVNIAELIFPKDLNKLPLTTKAELISNQKKNPPWGTALTEPIERYTRYNQTSSTTGLPLRWLDTTESWQWMLDCWKSVYHAARVNSQDRIFFPFSFGPFLGFWTAFEAGTQIGAHCIPAGGMTSRARLAFIHAIKPTIICCTPTYALRLLEVARETYKDLDSSISNSVKTLIVAGEPGGSIASTRARIEQGWHARVIDHHGMTEVGPISFECWENPGNIHLNECEFICEILDPDTRLPVKNGEQGELVITNLGRTASPVIRYKTGDLVVVSNDCCPCGRTLILLKGGIRSRIDDMVCVNGVNIYPATIETVMRAIDEVVEYRATIRDQGALRTLAVEIEVTPSTTQPDMVSQRTELDFREVLGLTVPVTIVASGTLPRFDMKAKRFVIVP